MCKPCIAITVVNLIQTTSVLWYNVFDMKNLIAICYCQLLKCVRVMFSILSESTPCLYSISGPYPGLIQSLFSVEFSIKVSPYQALYSVSIPNLNCVSKFRPASSLHLIKYLSRLMVILINSKGLVRSL